MNYKKILKQSIDLHVHIGPEIIPRRFVLSELLNYEAGKIKGVGIKNHFFPTVAMTSGKVAKDAPFVINSLVLNRYVGGFSPDTIRASAELSEKPIIVWFPTLHTKAFLESQKFEIPKEWIGSKKLKIRLARDIKPLSIFDKSKKISKEVQQVLRAIKECGAILATGHLSWQESYVLVTFAVKEVGINKIIITHPIYQKINMPIEVQKELARMGAFIEQCYSMYSIDKISIKKIAGQIKEIGAQNCILSSDVGQVFSKSPSEALADFILLLEKDGITEQEIKKMLVSNSRKLIWP
jgi:DNA-directed RNA polymerase subunit L